MAIPNVSSPSQALASYAAQLQAGQTRNREPGYDVAAADRAGNAQSGDRVTLSAQANQNLNQNANRPGDPTVNRGNEAERAASTQAVERKQSINPEEARAATSKSVTQALEAYAQTSLV